jgi:hypothetical protein
MTVHCLIGPAQVRSPKSYSSLSTIASVGNGSVRSLVGLERARAGEHPDVVELVVAARPAVSDLDVGLGVVGGEVGLDPVVVAVVAGAAGQQRERADEEQGALNCARAKDHHGIIACVHGSRRCRCRRHQPPSAYSIPNGRLSRASSGGPPSPSKPLTPHCRRPCGWCRRDRSLARSGCDVGEVQGAVVAEREIDREVELGVERRAAVALVARFAGSVDVGGVPATRCTMPSVDHPNQVIAGVGEVQIARGVEHDAPGRGGRLAEGLRHSHLGGRDLVARVAGRARACAQNSTPDRRRRTCPRGRWGRRGTGPARLGTGSRGRSGGGVDDAASGEQLDVAVGVDVRRT